MLYNYYNMRCDSSPTYRGYIIIENDGDFLFIYVKFIYIFDIMFPKFKEANYDN